MKLIIDREALKRRIMEDDYDGEVESGVPVSPELLTDILKRHVAASDAVEANGQAHEG